MRRLHIRRGAALGAIAALLVTGGAAMAATLPTAATAAEDCPGPADVSSQAQLQQWQACRLDRLESIVMAPDTTATVTKTTTAPPVTETTTTTETVTATVTVSPGVAFPPAAGTLFYGASEDSNVVLEQQTGHPLGVDREYFQSGDAAAMADYARAAAAKGSLPFVSIKPPADWQSVAQGQHDGWVNDVIARLAAIEAPVLWTIHHEPENDVNGTTQTAATFKAMCEHVTVMHDTAQLVRFGPVLMSGKYNPIPTPNVDKRLKVQDWASPQSGHFFGFDGYNHYDPISGRPWRTVHDTFDWMVNGGVYGSQPEILGFKDVDPNKPIVIAEYGVRDDPNSPGEAAAWMQEAYDYALDQGLAGMSYFSSGNNVNDGGGAWKLAGERLDKFDELLKLPSSVLLTK